MKIESMNMYEFIEECEERPLRIVARNIEEAAIAFRKAYNRDITTICFIDYVKVAINDSTENEA